MGKICFFPDKTVLTGRLYHEFIVPLIFLITVARISTFYNPHGPLVIDNVVLWVAID